MNYLKLFFTQDKSSYNITMIVIYIVITLAALAVCVIISNKLKIYGPKVYKSLNKKINKTINTENLAQNHR